MELTAARVSNFKCVEDSGEFSIARVTCLVGKNESGKTTLLQALHGLKPYGADKYQFDKLRDYPRRFFTDYDERHKGAEAKVIESKWRLYAEDVKAVEAVLGKGSLKQTTVVVSKYYGSH